MCLLNKAIYFFCGSVCHTTNNIMFHGKVATVFYCGLSSVVAGAMRHFFNGNG